MLYRLAKPGMNIRRVYTIIRGPNPISRLPGDLRPYVATRKASGEWTSEPIIILNGDCYLPGMGLPESEQHVFDEVDIVIHAAG